MVGHRHRRAGRGRAGGVLDGRHGDRDRSSRSIRCWRWSRSPSASSPASRSARRPRSGWSPARARTGKIRFVAKTASQTTRTYRVEVEIAERRRHDSGRHHRGSVAAARAGAGDAHAALGADLLLGRRPRRAHRRCATTSSRSCRSTSSRTSRPTCGSPASADGARVIVQGQDFVREGQKVEPVPAAAAARRHRRSSAAYVMSQAHRLRHQPCAADHRDAHLPAARGLRRLCDDPEGGGAGRPDPDHLRAAVAARHQPGGRRAAAAAAGRDAAEVGRQRQGDALDRLRGRRLSCCSSSRPASIPSPRSPTCAPRSTRPSTTCRATSTSRRCSRSISRSIRCWWSALSGDVPERTLLRIARAAKNAIEQAPGVLSAELRGARDEAVEIIAEPMLMKSYGVSLDQLGQRSRSRPTA